jgi:hypothetical protein
LRWVPVPRIAPATLAPAPGSLICGSSIALTPTAPARFRIALIMSV